MKYLILALLLTVLLFTQNFPSVPQIPSVPTFNDVFDSEEIFQTNEKREIREIWGTMFIKDSATRDSVRNLINTTMSKEDFESFKKFIKRKQRNLRITIFPLDNSTARIEIEKKRSRKYVRKPHRSVDFEFEKHDFDPSHTDFDHLSIVFPGLADIQESGKDRIMVGVEAAFEQNFFRGFLGIRYQHVSDSGNFFRVGAGAVSEGVFQANFSYSDEGKAWRMSHGDWSKNLMITPQHIIGQTYLDFSMVHAEFLTTHHAFRLNHGFNKSALSYPDSTKEDNANVLGLKADYTFAYLDDNLSPNAGVYFNLKGQALILQEKFKGTPYKLGNSYSNDWSNYGTYSNTGFANLQVLIPVTSTGSVYIGGQAVYQEFNINDSFGTANDFASTNFSKQIREMYSPKLGLRVKMDDSSITQISFGVNQTYLKERFEADWRDYYLEAKMTFGSVFEIKYTYVYEQEVNNPSNIRFIKDLIHNQVGATISAGFVIGNLN
jgi:hypothetical protein